MEVIAIAKPLGRRALDLREPRVDQCLTEVRLVLVSDAAELLLCGGQTEAGGDLGRLGVDDDVFSACIEQAGERLGVAGEVLLERVIAELGR